MLAGHGAGPELADVVLVVLHLQGAVPREDVGDPHVGRGGVDVGAVRHHQALAHDGRTPRDRFGGGVHGAKGAGDPVFPVARLVDRVDRVEAVHERVEARGAADAPDARLEARAVDACSDGGCASDVGDDLHRGADDGEHQHDHVEDRDEVHPAGLDDRCAERGRVGGVLQALAVDDHPADAPHVIDHAHQHGGHEDAHDHGGARLVREEAGRPILGRAVRE